MEELMNDISSLSACIRLLEDAKKSLNDVDDACEIYAEIHNIEEKVIDLKTQKEIALEKGAEE